jgi:hypothetical protein
VDYKVAGHEIDVGEDGSFEIFVSSSKPEGVTESKWLKLLDDPSQGMLIVRQTFLSRQDEIKADVPI